MEASNTRNKVSGTEISIVIPSLNEERNMPHLISGIRRIMSGKKYEVIVVDGYSTDNTAVIAENMGARVLYDNVGKGSALIKGLLSARGEILISMDADLSHEPRELGLLVSSIKSGYDICMGSRFIAGGNSEDISAIRAFGNKVFVVLVNSLFKSHYSDICYGYRSFNKKILQRLNLSERGFGIEAEISIKAAKLGLKTIEVPSTEKKRSAEEAKLRTFRDGYIILKTILRNALGS